MSVKFEIMLHNVPQETLENARFEREFKKGVQKLLTGYQLDNDLDGTSIDVYVAEEASEDKEVFITCAKIAKDTNFNDLELGLMNEIADLLGELAEKHCKRPGKRQTKSQEPQ